MKYFLLLVLPVFTGCISKTQKNNAFTYEAPYEKDPSLKRILVENPRKICDLIGLNPLEKGTDSFEIRVTLGFGLIMGLDIFSIRKDSFGWTGRHFYFQEQSVPAFRLGEARYEMPNTEVDSIWMGKPFVPICGWPTFIDSLRFFNLYEIRDQNQMNECKLGGFDGTIAIIELATKNHYKWLHHWISGNSNCDEFVRFKEFIQMMEMQLGINYCWPRCWPIETNNSSK